MKTCSKCKTEQSMSNFYFMKSKSAYYSWCKECCKAENRHYKKEFKDKHGFGHTTAWRNKDVANKKKSNLWDRERNKRMKLALVTAYGGVCTCCGEHRIEFLTLEHINHDGKEHRTRIGGAGHRGGHKLYRDVLQQGCPDNYTIFCMNCNFAEKDGNPCPHKKEREKKILPFIVKDNKLAGE